MLLSNGDDEGLLGFFRVGVGERRTGVYLNGRLRLNYAIGCHRRRRAVVGVVVKVKPEQSLGLNVQ